LYRVTQTTEDRVCVRRGRVVRCCVCWQSAACMPSMTHRCALCARLWARRARRSPGIHPLTRAAPHPRWDATTATPSRSEPSSISITPHLGLSQCHAHLDPSARRAQARAPRNADHTPHNPWPRWHTRRRPRLHGTSPRAEVKWQLCAPHHTNGALESQPGKQSPPNDHSKCSMELLRCRSAQ